MVTQYSNAADEVWKAISDGKRRKIVDALASGRKTTGEIVDLFPTVGRTGILKHIGVLEKADLIIVEREGRVRWNYLNPAPIKRACNPWVRKHVERISSSIARLKKIAEFDA